MKLYQNFGISGWGGGFEHPQTPRPPRYATAVWTGVKNLAPTGIFILHCYDNDAITITFLSLSTQISQFPQVFTISLALRLSSLFFLCIFTTLSLRF